MSSDPKRLEAARPPTLDDAALVERVRSGDGAAFELLMRRHNRRLYRVARSLLGDSAEAEDAVQEAYLAAFQSLGAFRGDSSLATWLSRVVVNECMTRRRRQARRDNIVPILSANALAGDDDEGDALAEVPAAAHHDTPDRALVRSELRALLERKVDDLPADFRAVFMLRCVEELTVEETAQCLAIPEATVRTRAFRARSLLRESIAQEIDLAERDLFGFDGERCDRIVAQVLRRCGLA